MFPIHSLFLPNPALVSRNALSMWIIAAGVFLISFSLGTRSNSFPYYYHLDEPLKVQLLLQNDTNFNHPLLMRNVTDGVARLTGVPRTPQNMVVIGRTCSAAFGAIAAVAFAWLAYHFGGLLAGAAAGLLVALHPLLFELTHYYKEDPALLMGMALSFLAFTHYWDKPGALAAVWVGAAAAVAFSGKYMGIVALPLSLAAILAGPGQPLPRRFRHVAILLAVFAAVVAMMNFQWLTHVGGVTSGVGREIALLGSAGGQNATFALAPDDKYFGAFMSNTNLLIGFFVAWQIIRMVVTRASFPEWLIVGFAVTYAVVLSFVPKTAGRYFLPVSATVCYLAGLGLTSFAASAARWLRMNKPAATILTVALILAASATFLPPILKLERGFSTDSRKELARWIEANVSPTDVIAQDSRVQLVGSEPKDISDRAFTVPQTVLTSDFAADLGTVSALQARGVTYVATEPSGHGKKSTSGSTKAERKAFNATLSEQAELVWSCKSQPPKILHPALKLYRLKPVAPSQKP